MMIETFWAVERHWLQNYVKTIDGATAEQMELASSRFKATAVDDILTVSGESATIHINGFLSPTGPSAFAQFFGISGTSLALIREAAHAIMADDEVKNVTLQIDSPGGTVTGTDETFQVLAQMAKTKEVVAINNGMIASGAYWLSVAADRIVAASPTAETGSIGVIVVALDWTEAFEKFGVHKVVIVSENAPKKNADISNDEGVAIIKERLDAIEGIFIARVAGGRGVTEAKVIKDFGKGGVLIAQDAREDKADAVSVGMIDEVTSPTGQAVANENDSDIETDASNNVDGGNVVKTLKELLQENPAASAEFDAAIQKAASEGAAKVTAEVVARVAVAKPIMEADKYPDAIKNLAIQVVTGETGADALKSAVAVVDSLEEKKAETDAADDADDKDTPPNAGGPGASDGTIETEADLEAAADRLNPKAKKGE